MLFPAQLSLLVLVPDSQTSRLKLYHLKSFSSSYQHCVSFHTFEDMPITLADSYRASMKDHPYGYALFEPQLYSARKPGMCGYLDEYKRWKPIANLTDNKSLEANGYGPVGPLQLSDVGRVRWGPLKASTVKKVKEFGLTADSSALAQGLPVTAEVAVKYKASTRFGAMLMCDGDIEVEGYDHSDQFRRWLRGNAKLLLRDYPSIKKYCITNILLL